jgi:catechol 2,3-dioxygenase-like lactoylglutathione lyase family enzyme
VGLSIERARLIRHGRAVRRTRPNGQHGTADLRPERVAIPTGDIARAIAWYRDVLGLPESQVSDGEVETPNVTLSFWQPEIEGLPFTPYEAGFGIRVAEVSAARAELEAKGVEFIAQTWDSGVVCHFAAFRDPGRQHHHPSSPLRPRIPRDRR